METSLSKESAKIVIRGLPIALKRARACRAPNMRSGIRMYSTQKEQFARIKEKALKELPKDWKPYNKFIGLQVTFGVYFRIPISCPKNKRDKLIDVNRIKKPDLSNVIKFYEDALNRVLWMDDAQICEISAYKAYSDHPRVEIEIIPVRCEYDVTKEMQQMRENKRNL